jgi:hypothetical protein
LERTNLGSLLCGISVGAVVRLRLTPNLIRNSTCER